MLVTAKINEYQQPNMEIRSKSAKNHSSTKARLCLIGAIVLVFVFGVYYTSLSAKIASKGYQLERLEKEITELQTKNERTELIVASMSSLDKVEQLATETLGMNKPNNNDAPMLMAEAGLGGSEEIAGPGGSDSLQGEESNVFSAEAVYTAFASFFEIRKAEASPGTR